MEGLEVSEVKLSDVRKGSYSYRWDSSYFLKEYLNNPLNNIETEFVNNLFDINSGTTPRDRNDELKEGVILLKTTDIRNNILQDNKDKYYYISSNINSRMQSTELKAEDVLINIVGATTDVIGRTSFVHKEFPKSNITQAMSLLRAKQEKVLPYYLFAFLISKFGNLQVRKFARQTGQFNMNYSELGAFSIPIQSLKFQKKVKENILKVYELENQSKLKYIQAEDLLFKEIGLKDFKASESSVNVKNFKDSFVTSGRLDSEYYQPKYDIIEKAIKNYHNGYNTLESFTENYSTGYPFKSSTYIKEKGVPLIRINNINKGHLDIANAIQIPSQDIELSPKDVALENDILISMSGTIGNSCRIPKGVKAVINQRIMRITPKNFNNEVLPMVINSLIGDYQLNRIGTGGVQTNISAKDVKQIFIPNLEKGMQKEVAELIVKSFTLKKQGEHLLEVAKRAVEIAIEENEENALEYIKTETNE